MTDEEGNALKYKSVYISTVNSVSKMTFYEISGQVFLVTGGAVGIGGGFVKVIAEEAKHVAVFDIDEQQGVALQHELNNKYGANRVKFYKVDVTNESQVDEAFDDVVKKHGNIDTVVNSAGIMNDSPRLFKKEIEINVSALVYLTMKQYSHARTDKGGKGGTVINISSIAALQQSNCIPIYYATKSAVMQFSNCLGKEKNYNRTGVRVVTVCFSATDTPLFSKMSMFDETFDEEVRNSLMTEAIFIQKLESAVNGLVEAYKRGGPGSTWVAANDQPVLDHTEKVNQAYAILSSAFTY